MERKEDVGRDCLLVTFESIVKSDFAAERVLFSIFYSNMSLLTSQSELSCSMLDESFINSFFLVPFLRMLGLGGAE